MASASPHLCGSKPYQYPGVLASRRFLSGLLPYDLYPEGLMFRPCNLPIDFLELSCYNRTNVQFWGHVMSILPFNRQEDSGLTRISVRSTLDCYLVRNGDEPVTRVYRRP